MKRRSNVENDSTLVAVRITEGDFYLIGIRSEGKDYVYDYHIPLDRDDLMMYPTGGYAKTFLDVFPVSKEKIYDSRKNRLIAAVQCYTRNGKSDPDDRDIFEVEDSELADMIDALRDGYYIFIVNN